MPKTSVTTEVVTTTEVKLSPALKKKLSVQVKLHQEAQAEINQLEETKKKVKKEVERLFVDAGEGNALMDGVKIDNVPVQMVVGTRSVFDKKRALDFMTEAQMEECYDDKPNKPYVKIGGGRSEKEG